MSAGRHRVEEARAGMAPWLRWGPCLSERQWGIVREDHSDSGDAWNHFTHDHARSRAYRWGEDGLAGISDDQLRLCFAPARSAVEKRMRGVPFGDDFDAVFEARRREADEFYATVIPPSMYADQANVMRQALAGMLWSMQYYHFGGGR